MTRRTAAELDQLRINDRTFAVRIVTPERKDGKTIDHSSEAKLQNEDDAEPFELVGKAIAHALDGALIQHPLLALAEAALRVHFDQCREGMRGDINDEANAFRRQAMRLIEEWNR